MRRLSLVMFLLVLLLTSSGEAADGDIAAEITQIDTSDYPNITLYVSVTDEEGRLIEGLQQDEFRVTEDGKPVDVIDFSAGIRSSIATVLTIDRSGSMDVEDKLTGAKTAALTFVDLMRTQDQAAVIVFDTVVEVTQPFTTDKDVLKEQIRSIMTGGCTAWYDGIYDSVEIIASLEGRRSVILLSDGIDCSEDFFRRLLGEGSKRSLDEAIQHAVAASIPVYTIGLGAQVSQEVSNEGYDEVKLQRAATETGGAFYHAPNAGELEALYRSLSEEMQKEYVLTYHSPRPTYDGTRRNIVVAVTPGGGDAVTTEGKYLEQHLVNVRSSPVLFLIFLLPLGLLLLAPAALGFKKRRQQPQDVTGISAEAPSWQPSPVARQTNVESQTAGGVDQSWALAAQPTPIPPAAAPAVISTNLPASAHLLVRYPLGLHETTVGRANTNAIVLTDSSIANSHARLIEQAQWYVIHDLSGGRTYVSFNGDPAQERAVASNALREGSTLRFGQVRATFRAPVGNEKASLEVEFPLRERVRIGSDLSCDIVVNQSQVPAQQAEVRNEGGRWVVHAIAGSGSTWVSFDGDLSHARPVQVRNALKSGSVLRIGDAILELRNS